MGVGSHYGANAAVQVPSHTYLLAGGFGVHVHNNDAVVPEAG